MADEQLVENLVLIESLERPDYISVKLIPKTNAEFVVKKMGHPTHYTSLYSLSKLVKLEGFKIPGAYGMIRITTRAPYMFHQNFEDRLRVAWLGKAEETIQGELDQLVEMMQRVKNDSVNKRFNLPEVRVDKTSES